MSTRLLALWLVLAVLLGACSPTLPRPSVLAEAPPLPAASVGEIERKLKAPVSVDFQDTPLRQVLANLCDAYGLSMEIDQPALQEAGITLAPAISEKLQGISLQSVLQHILHQAKLTFVVKDEVLQITTVERARGPLLPRTYAVADLVVPPEDLEDAPSFGPTKVTTREEALIHMLVTNIAPPHWADCGGPGTVEYCPKTMSLVVSQHANVHEQVADFLAALREFRDAQVVLEARWLVLGGPSFVRLVTLRPSTKGPPLPWTLDDRQLLAFLAACQGDPSATVRASRFVLLNGQRASVCVRGQPFAARGTQMALRPTISPFGGEVTVELDPIVFTQFGFGQQPGVVRLPCDQAPRIPVGKTAVLWVGPWDRAGPYQPNPQAEQVVLLLTPRLVAKDATAVPLSKWLRGYKAACFHTGR